MDRRGCQDQFAGMVVNTPPVKRNPITPNDERSSDSTLRRPVVFAGKGINSSTNRAVVVRPGTCTVTVLLPRVSRYLCGKSVLLAIATATREPPVLSRINRSLELNCPSVENTVASDNLVPLAP